MKNANKIYSFFIAIALLFWNPLSFLLFYSRKPVYNLTVVHLFIWVVFLAGVLAIYGISKNKGSTRLRNLILAVTFTGILYSFVVIINVGIGRINRSKHLSAASANNDDREGGLVFAPNSKARYKTTEFDFTADINSIGLRDKEIEKDKGNKFRILCFGDSWTFGWGVQQEKSWPHQLEVLLHKAGKTNIEVINCGRGGQYTSTYLQYMQSAVPMLNPDMVLVGVLQEDDLAQLFEMNFKTPSGSDQTGQVTPPANGALAAVQEMLTASFSNITGLFRKKRNTDAEIIDISTAWKESATKFLSGLDEINRHRFYTLPDTVQQMFLSGNLNPSLVSGYVKFPDRVTVFNNPAQSATKFAINQMIGDFEKMKAICDKNGAKLVFVNLPINFFIGHSVERCASDVLNPYFETNNKIDSIYASVAGKVGVPYMELTGHFRQLINKGDYFFRFDGHPNERGYAEIANFVSIQLLTKDLAKTQ
jgi:lysophospholipase L1-like esterase